MQIGLAEQEVASMSDALENTCFPESEILSYFSESPSELAEAL